MPLFRADILQLSHLVVKPLVRHCPWEQQAEFVADLSTARVHNSRAVT